MKNFFFKVAASALTVTFFSPIYWSYLPDQSLSWEELEAKRMML